MVDFARLYGFRPHEVRGLSHADYLMFKTAIDAERRMTIG